MSPHSRFATSLLPSSSAPLLRSSALRALEAQHHDQPLMERAGAAAAEVANTLVTNRSRILVLAGPGNNGGDAFVAARQLHAAGHSVDLVFTGRPAALPDDARMACARWQAYGQPILADVPDGRYSLVIDGLFGIGLTRPISGPYAALIERINGFRALGGPVLALDLPSGLDADTGAIHGVAVHASHTASFLADKPGLHTLAGPDHAGQLSVHRLGVATPASNGARLSPADFATALAPRQRNSHKGSHGSLAIIGGADGMCGAALLAARAGLHLGAGRLFVGLLATNRPALDPLQPELMLRGAEDAATQATTLVVGPGMGLDDNALMLLRRLTGTEFPLLLDADALSLTGAHPVIGEHLRRRTAPTILTPHPAEAARLLHCSIDEVQGDRIAAAVALAEHFQACVALKGCGTVLARPNGLWRINTTGNPGLATGGTGDVLAGMIGAFLAQGLPAWQALGAGVFLHGAAADYLISTGTGPIGMSASELVVPARALLNTLVTSRAEQSGP